MQFCANKSRYIFTNFDFLRFCENKRAYSCKGFMCLRVGAALCVRPLFFAQHFGETVEFGEKNNGETEELGGKKFGESGKLYCLFSISLSFQRLHNGLV